MYHAINFNISAFKRPINGCFDHRIKVYESRGGNDQKSLATFAKVLYIVDYLGLTLPAPSQIAGGDPVGNIAFPLSPTSAGGGGDGPLHIYILLVRIQKQTAVLEQRL
jgi:hypothetical protein